MQQTFDRYRSGYARWGTGWTKVLLNPPAHVLNILERAGRLHEVATAFVNGFDDPRTLFPWFMDPAESDAFIRKAAQAVAERFDRRDFRRALGQFATGVTVVTARAPDGRNIGVTVNSFASVSLNPPLISWSLARQTPSFSDFANCSHFAVNVL